MSGGSSANDRRAMRPPPAGGYGWTVAAVFFIGLAVAALVNWRHARAQDRQLDAALAVADVLAVELVPAVKPAAGTKTPEVLRVLRRVEETVAALATHTSDPKAAHRLARLRLGLAEVHTELGEGVLALGHAARARRGYADLAARFPEDADARRGIARADFRLGRTYYELGHSAAAEPFFVQAAAGFAGLRESYPDDGDLEAEYLDAIAWRVTSWEKFGWGQHTGDLRQSLAAGRAALAARPDAKPQWVANHGKSLEAEADRLYFVADAAAEPDRPAAVETCRKQYAAAIDLYRRAGQGEPWNVEFRVRLLEASLSVVELLALAGDHAGMAALLPPLEELAAELLAANPGTADIQRDHLRTRQDRARRHLVKGTREKSPEELRTALSAYSDLAAFCRERIAVYPRQAAWVGRAVEQGQNAGKVAFQLADWKAASVLFGQAVTVWEGHPDRFSADQLGTWYLDLIAHLAVAHERRGDRPAARAVIERGRRFATDRGLADAEKVLDDHLKRAGDAPNR